MKGILGRKLGMSQVFTENGKLIPVSVIEIAPNVVTQVKTQEKDGYDSLQLSAFDQLEQRITKPLLGHFKKAETSGKKIIREIRDMKDFNLSDVVKVDDVFEVGTLVDVSGVSKGKGFQGRIKRYNQKRGPMAHGSGYHRQMGSTGAISANRVFKGSRFPGHMGHENSTISNLEVIKVDSLNNYLLVKGAIPGPKKGWVVVKEAIKKTNKKINPVVLAKSTYQAAENNVEITGGQ